MPEYRGSILTSNVLAFGILAFIFVSIRIGFRLYSRKVSASDWVLVVALVSRTLPPTSFEERMGPQGRPPGLMMCRQISSLAQDAFNAACELYRLCNPPIQQLAG